MSVKNHNPPPKKETAGLKPTPIGTMIFKVHDLKRDVTCLKTVYSSSSDPNKGRIERVLSNMNRKLSKTEQMMKFGQNVTEYCITQDRTRFILKRVQKIKELFKDLLKGQGTATTQERRSLCQMFHQILSMEDDLIHFADPEQSFSSSGGCRSIDEPHWAAAEDYEVQAMVFSTTESNETPNEKIVVRNNLAKEKIVCCSCPEIEELSDRGNEETRNTVFSINNRRRNTPDDIAENFMSADSSNYSLYSSTDDDRCAASAVEIDDPCFSDSASVELPKSGAGGQRSVVANESAVIETFSHTNIVL